MHGNEYSWVVKIRITSEAVLRPQYHTDHGPRGLGRCDGLGASYCLLCLSYYSTPKSGESLIGCSESASGIWALQ